MQFGQLKRREFIALLGGAAAAWPLAARAQQPGKLPTVGFMGANNAAWERASTDAFVQRLRELGWIENRTVAIEYRWAEGRDELFAEIAAEFIRLKVESDPAWCSQLAAPTRSSRKRTLGTHTQSIQARLRSAQW